MSKKIKSIPITIEDVAFIFNNNLDDFYFVTSHCYCSHCNDEEHNATITNYSILLNGLNDLELAGFCLKCGNKIGRYIETGDNPVAAENAEAIWETNSTLKELKIKKTK